MSSFSSTFTSFCSFLLSLFILFYIVIAVDPLAHFCENSANFTAGSLYEKHLVKLLGDLYLKTPSTGFGLAGGRNQETPFGLSLCRGDISTQDCKACVTNARSSIRNLCPNNKAATIWYEKCFLKYSNDDFFGTIDRGIVLFSCNPSSVSDSMSFNQTTQNLLNKLSKKASVTPKKFATGKSEVKGSQKLFGLVQCTRDLSGVDCKKCLDDTVSSVPHLCSGQQGGTVLGGSCGIRYESYPFFSA